MGLGEERNIVTLLAVERAYNYFIPRLNNVEEMQRAKSEAEQGQGLGVEGPPTGEGLGAEQGTCERKRLSFVRLLKLDKVAPRCDCDKDEQGRCTRMQGWLEVSRSNELGLSEIYRELIGMVEYVVRMEGSDVIEIDMASNGLVNRIFGNRVMNSIYMDVCRTYPSVPYFKYEGKSYLNKILLVYSLMDLDVGYVQGMNFLVGCILWHSSSEEQAFELLVSIMFNYGMREMFVSGLPGLRVKCRILDLLMEREIHTIWDHIIRQGGTVDMLATDWFLTLFSYSIPLNTIGKFWDDFFQQGWTPLYKLILYRLQRIEPNILHSTDIADIMNAIKYSIPTSKNGIFGNAFLNLKDELGKSNVARFFNNINTLFSSSQGNDQTGHHSGPTDSEEALQEAGSSGTNGGSGRRPGATASPTYLTNDPNMVSLPHVWSELITEAQFEVELDVDYIQELELKFSGSCGPSLSCSRDIRYRSQDYQTPPSPGSLNMRSFEYFFGNDEIKEKEEQDEEQSVSSSPIATRHKDGSKPNNDDDLTPSQHSAAPNSLDASSFPREASAKDQIVSRYRKHYREIISSIFGQDEEASSPNPHTSGNQNDHKSREKAPSKSIFEIKHRLESSLGRLLNVTEALLVKSINKDHLKELSIKCKEIQKNKFGPWAYQH